jgi:hypothetical protein
VARPGHCGSAGNGGACGLWPWHCDAPTAQHDAVHDALKNADANTGNDAYDDFHD